VKGADLAVEAGARVEEVRKAAEAVKVEVAVRRAAAVVDRVVEAVAVQVVRAVQVVDRAAGVAVRRAEVAEVAVADRAVPAAVREEEDRVVVVVVSAVAVGRAAVVVDRAAAVVSGEAVDKAGVVAADGAAVVDRAEAAKPDQQHSTFHNGASLSLRAGRRFFELLLTRRPAGYTSAWLLGSSIT
jgi:hypothetical protein